MRRALMLFLAVIASGLVLSSPAGSSSLQAGPGPSHVQRVLPRGTIQWLFRHEPRGLSLAQARIPLGSLVGSHWQPVRFARVLRPDPTTNIRIAVSLIGKRGLNICVTTFEASDSGGGCAVGLLLKPFDAQLSGDTSFALLSGLASDSVARMTLFLANGSRLPVPLKDNAFAIRAPQREFPVNLVAYDSRGRVVGVNPWN
jgi:hypothetical protein